MFEQVKGIIEKYTEVETITPESELGADLGLSSFGPRPRLLRHRAGYSRLHPGASGVTRRQRRIHNEKAGERPSAFSRFVLRYRMLLAQLISEFCQTFSRTSLRIWSVTGPFFAIFARITACSCSTVICS